MKVKSFAVIGLGRFGMTIARTIAEMGHEVLGVDADEEAVQKVTPYVTHVAVLDATDEEALREIGINNFDVVVVAIGANLQGNLMTTMLLKEMGVRYLVAKSQDQLQGRMLEKIGVDMVIYPERDMAIRVAQSLTREHVLDYFKLSNEVSLVEMETPHFLVGKSLLESRLREDYQVSIVAIRRNEEVFAPPSPLMALEPDDILIIVGRNEAVNALDQSMDK